MTIRDINIRTTSKPGDIGYIIHMHGRIYGEEYGYGLPFEAYVAESMAEFCHGFSHENECMWFCEHNDRIIGFISLVNRGELAQLRYFIIEREYRGLGLGKLLMNHFVDFMNTHNYVGAYLMTSDELPAAASLYRRYGFELVSEEPSESFGKRVILQRYQLKQPVQ